jgi:hypothetical protein
MLRAVEVIDIVALDGLMEERHPKQDRQRDD